MDGALALDGARFASGRPVTAADVAGSLDLARSPTCKLGDLCATAINQLDAAETAQDGTAVTPGSRRSTFRRCSRRCSRGCPSSIRPRPTSGRLGDRDRGGRPRPGRAGRAGQAGARRARRR
ncbi:MAG: hypothetical protein R3C32_08995 [Chloroflexota bacterium]